MKETDASWQGRLAHTDSDLKYVSSPEQTVRLILLPNGFSIQECQENFECLCHKWNITCNDDEVCSDNREIDMIVNHIRSYA